MKCVRQLPFILLAALLLSFHMQGSRKGCAGKYYISGIAYLKRSVISSGELKIKMGNDQKSWTVLTDDEGKFEIAIPWMSACPSGLSAEERNWENERLNPSPIVITYGESRIELNNEWKKYGKCFSESKEEITWKKDLHFTAL